MIRHIITGTSVAQDTNNIAAAVTAASGVAFTLITNEMPDSLAHKIIITPSGSVTGNYTISGNDADGYAISETLATNTTNAVTSVKYYKDGIVVTAPAGLGAETVSIGYTADSVSARVVPVQSAIRQSGGFNIGFVVAVASATYTVQHTYDGSNWYNHSTVAAETTAQEGTYTSPVAGIRLMWAAAGTATMTALQLAD